PAAAPAPVDFAELVGRAIETARQAYPQRTVRVDLGQVPPVLGDGQRLLQTADLLLLYACDRAAEQVAVRVAGDGTETAVEWAVEDDGPPLSAEQLRLLFLPFAAPRQGLAQVGLTLGHRLVVLHGRP